MRRLGKRVRTGAQEQESGDKPDIKRPPDWDLPTFDQEAPDDTAHPEAPPFTGEDVEDTPRRAPSDLPVM
jgi:hypothetical protein